MSFQIVDFSGDVFYDGVPDTSTGISNITGTAVNRLDKNLTEILNKEWVYLPFRWDMTTYHIVCSETGIVSFEGKDLVIKHKFLKDLLEFEQEENPELCVFIQNLNKCFTDAGRQMRLFEPPYIQGVDITLVLYSDNEEDCKNFARKIYWRHPEILTVVYRQRPTIPVKGMSGK